jgi:tetratricopeptide (TPR) repeat protein
MPARRDCHSEYIYRRRYKSSRTFSTAPLYLFFHLLHCDKDEPLFIFTRAADTVLSEAEGSTLISQISSRISKITNLWLSYDRGFNFCTLTFNFLYGPFYFWRYFFCYRRLNCCLSYLESSPAQLFQRDAAGKVKNVRNVGGYEMKALRYILKWLHSLFSTEVSQSTGIDSHKQENKIKEEIEAFERAIHIKPDDAEAYYTLAATYDSIGRSQEAIASYKEAIRIDPDFPPAHFLLGNRYVIDGNKESALQTHKELYKLDVDLADTLFDSISNWTFANANDS